MQLENRSKDSVKEYYPFSSSEYQKPHDFIKLYVAILDSPQINSLSDHLWRRLIEVMLLAATNPDNNLLSFTDMSQSLHISEEELNMDMRELGRLSGIKFFRLLEKRFSEREKSND